MKPRQIIAGGIDTYVVYPLLFALLPIVSLYSSNVELLSVFEIARPLFLALASVVVITILLFLVVPDKHNRALVVLGFVVSFYAWPYWTILSAALAYLGLVTQAIEIGLLILLCLGGGYGILYLRKTRYSLYQLTGLLNIIALGSMLTAVVMVDITSVDIGIGLRKTVGLGGRHENFPSDHPDIFHIVLDGYGRSDVLNDLYGYDNGPFIESLEEMGFYVAPKSVSNYHWTNQSLSSMFNYVYLQERVKRGKQSFSTPRIHETKVLRLVEELGYTTIAFASGHAHTENRRADVYLRPRNNRSDFEVTMLQRRRESEQEVKVLHRRRVQFIMDSLESLSPNQYGRPMFVFAHIKSPHSPFVFGKNGEEVERVWNKDPEQSVENVTLYRNQAEYIISRMTQVVRAIRTNFPEAIIILHGDHGARSRAIRMGTDPQEDFIKDHVGILNALYLPGEKAADALYASISLVNIYRVILNEYFGFHLALLEDAYYIAEPRRYDWWTRSIASYTRIVHSP